MKNIYILCTLIAGLFIFNSCNNEPDFPGLDEVSQIKNVAKYVVTYTGGVFSENSPAKNTLPAWLDAKYKAADKGSTAMVDYKYTISTPAYITALAGTKPYTLTTTDYKEVWGDDSALNYFSPSKPAKTLLPSILNNAIADPEEGEIRAVTFNEASRDGSEPVFFDNFESKTLDAWSVVNTEGTYVWQSKSFTNNFYAQVSANGHTSGALETYLISAEPISIQSGLVLTFDGLYCYYTDAGGRVSVLISDDLAGLTQADVLAATWNSTMNFTIPNVSGGSGDMTPVEDFSLNAYSGKTIYLAFKYEGNGDSNVKATTTFRLDNVVIKEATQIPVEYAPKNALYKYSEGVWALYEEAYILQPEDYTAIGIDYFTATVAQAYMPSLLAYKYPLVALNTVKAVIFKMSETTYLAIEYQKTITHWETTGGLMDLADEYEYDGTKWAFIRTVPKAALNITFNERTVTDKAKTEIEGWLNVSTVGTDYWKDRKYSNNNYVDASAFNATSDDKVEMWLITPVLEIKSNYILTFDMVSAYWKHESLEVYISSVFSGKAEDVPVVYSEDDNDEALAQSGKTVSGWERLTESFDFPKNTSTYSAFTNVGNASLDAYAGQTVYIAFRYWGNKTAFTSTVQIDNIYVGE